MVVLMGCFDFPKHSKHQEKASFYTGFWLYSTIIYNNNNDKNNLNYEW